MKTKTKELPRVRAAATLPQISAGAPRQKAKSAAVATIAPAAGKRRVAVTSKPAVAKVSNHNGSLQPALSSAQAQNGGKVASIPQFPKRDNRPPTKFESFENIIELSAEIEKEPELLEIKQIKLERRVQFLDLENQSLKDRLSQCEHSIGTLRATIENLNDDNEALKSKLSLREKELRQLHSLPFWKRIFLPKPPLFSNGNQNALNLKYSFPKPIR